MGGVEDVEDVEELQEVNEEKENGEDDDFMPMVVKIEITSLRPQQLVSAVEFSQQYKFVPQLFIIPPRLLSSTKTSRPENSPSQTCVVASNQHTSSTELWTCRRLPGLVGAGPPCDPVATVYTGKT